MSERAASRSGAIRLEKIDDVRWRIPKTGGMRVPGLIFADERMLRENADDRTAQQVANVAHLPGIVGASLAMPDMHWGYGFPIGGVAATEYPHGVISPGGVGYDINCGVRLMRTELLRRDVEKRLDDLTSTLFENVPCGVGSRGRLRLSIHQLREVLATGSRWAVQNGYGERDDLLFTEAGGCLEGADPEAVSARAMERGKDQLGTLGSGNHFLELGVVDEIYDEEAAGVMGLREEGVTFLIHTGSRGLGYQVCDDYLKEVTRAGRELGIDLPDRQLACVPMNTPVGKRYLAAMRAAANFAWANRQVIMHWCRQSLERVLRISPRDLGMQLVYDVAHNIAKVEEYVVEGRRMRVCVHRKGATRAFPAGHPEVPRPYQKVGQPVLIPGDMGRYSYVLVGTEQAMRETFGSSCHGAGRLKSRSEAKRTWKAGELLRDLESRGVVVRAQNQATLVEEAPGAYKDVSRVVDVVSRAGIARPVARLRPLGVIKG